jgi:hypothetical protein
MKCIATFAITSMAIMFERACRKEGLDVKVVPVPRHLSASCGLACSYDCSDEDQIKAICENKNIEVVEYHHT